MSMTTAHQLPLEEWGQEGAWRKFPLPKLRNTGAPSTNWGALLNCTLYTINCTLYTFPTQFFHTIFHTIFQHNCSHHFFTQFFKLFFHKTFPTSFFTIFFHQIYSPNLSTQFFIIKFPYYFLIKLSTQFLTISLKLGGQILWKNLVEEWVKNLGGKIG